MGHNPAAQIAVKGRKHFIAQHSVTLLEAFFPAPFKLIPVVVD
jgi:hypothetical protein